jgi:hypothetical protein
MASFHFHSSEYYHRHKSADWYWTVGIIAVASSITAFILGNILFAILIAIAALALTMYAGRAPHEHDIEINDSFITVGKYRYTYSNMESFWLDHSEHPRLLIRTNRTLMPHIIIPVDSLSDEEKEQIRQFLRTKLPEEEQHEPLLEMIMEYLGF